MFDLRIRLIFFFNPKSETVRIRNKMNALFAIGVVIAVALTPCPTEAESQAKNETARSLSPVTTENVTAISEKASIIIANSTFQNAEAKNVSRREGTDRLQPLIQGNLNNSNTISDVSTKSNSSHKFGRDSNSTIVKAVVPPLSSIFPLIFQRGKRQNPFLNFFHGFEKKTNGTEPEYSGVKKPIGGRPFLFLDIFFDIREIPIGNESEHKRETINIDFENKNPAKGIAEAKKTTSENKWQKRSVRDDDKPFFEDSTMLRPFDFEEFLPKPDFFFFPDFPLHRNPNKRLTRRKRDERNLHFSDDVKKFIFHKKKQNSKQDHLRVLEERVKKAVVSKKKEKSAAKAETIDRNGKINSQKLADAKRKRENEKRDVKKKR